MDEEEVDGGKIGPEADRLDEDEIVDIRLEGREVGGAPDTSRLELGRFGVRKRPEEEEPF